MKLFQRLIISLILLQAPFSTPSLAHHGKDYFISKSYHTPNEGTWAALFSADYLRLNSHREDELRGFGIEPGILYGLSNRWSLEIHSHIEKMAGENWHYESTGIEQRFQITRWDGSEDRQLPIGVAAALEFEKSSAHEGADVLQAGMILSNDGVAHNITANVLLRKELRRSASTEFRYALGAKTEISEFMGMAIEFNGTIGNEVLQQITPAIYLQTESGLRMRLGMSFGINGNRRDYALRSSLVFDLLSEEARNYSPLIL